MLESKKVTQVVSPQPPLARDASASAHDEVPQVGSANAGDHALIHRLLLAVQQNPSIERFSSWLEDPCYDPSNRILLRRGSQIIGHVHLAGRTIYWGGERIASASLFDLVALPEYDEPAGAGELLVAAEDRLREEGVVLAITRTQRPDLYGRLGWVRLRREGFSRASVHDILSHVTAQPPSDRLDRKYRVRTWRHVDTEKLADIYSQAARNLFGAVWRNDRYWHWLVGRNDHDSILLAEGPRSRRGGERPCVAYAVARQDRLIEVLALPGHEPAAVSLLARACREIVERGFHTVSLHLPAEHPLHEILLTADGEWCAISSLPPGRLMCKVFQFERYIERMFPILNSRAGAAELHLPCQLALDVDGRAFSFTLTRRSARFDRCSALQRVTPRIECSMDAFQRLLVGRLNIQAAVEDGTLRCNKPQAAAIASGLFSPLHAWQSYWDSPCW